MYYGTTPFGKSIHAHVDFSIIASLGFLLLGFAAFSAFYNYKKENPIFLFAHFLDTAATFTFSMACLIHISKIGNNFQSALKLSCDSDRNYVYSGIADYYTTYPEPYIFGVSNSCPVQIDSTTEKSIRERFNIYGVYYLNIDNIKGYISVPSDNTDPCYKEVYEFKAYKKNVALYFAYLERHKNCSGICHVWPINYFSDSRVIPGSECRPIIEKEASMMFRICVATSAVVFCWSIVGALLSILMLLHPDNMPNKKWLEKHNADDKDSEKDKEVEKEKKL